ncbi:hypothetical protein PT274_01975 [Leuconostocaceae bacterium ESL0958]|nr:hypothetical protein [Leuconostocaceae bacterium ESL0958]
MAKQSNRPKFSRQRLEGAASFFNRSLTEQADPGQTGKQVGETTPQSETLPATPGARTTEQTTARPVKRLKPLPAVHEATWWALPLGLMVFWSVQPIFFEKIWQHGYGWQSWPLICYALATAFAIGRLTQQRFQKSDWQLWGCAILSLLVIFNSDLRARFEIMALLLLFTVFLLLLPWANLQLQNVLGLLALALLVAFVIPIASYFLTYNYVAPSFIRQQWVLAAGAFFYLGPLLLPRRNGMDRLVTLIGYALLLVTLLLRAGLHVSTLVALLMATAALVLTYSRPLTYRIQPIVNAGCLACLAIFF